MEQNSQSVLHIDVPEVEPILNIVWTLSSAIEVPDPNIPAHITVQYPWIPPCKIDNGIIQELSLLFSAFTSFGYSLKLGWFDEEVLILLPDNPAPFIDLTKQIIEKWPEYPYYNGEYTNIEPHITLAYGNRSNLLPIYSSLKSHVPLQTTCTKICLSAGVPGHMTLIKTFKLGELCPEQVVALK